MTASRPAIPSEGSPTSLKTPTVNRVVSDDSILSESGRFGSHRRINVNALDSSPAEAWSDLEAELDFQGPWSPLPTDQPAMTLSCSFRSAPGTGARGRTAKAQFPTESLDPAAAPKPCRAPHALPTRGPPAPEPSVTAVPASSDLVSVSPALPSLEPPPTPTLTPDNGADAKRPDIHGVEGSHPTQQGQDQPLSPGSPSRAAAEALGEAEAGEAALVETLAAMATAADPRWARELADLQAKWLKEDTDQREALRRRTERLTQLWAIAQPTAEEQVQRRAVRQELEVLQCAHRQRVEDRQATLQQLRGRTVC
eukprot:EG_transcript_19146